MNIGMAKESLKQLYYNAKPYLILIFLQTCYAVNGLVVKYALNKGMNHYTFVVYQNAIAAIVFVPFALLFERKASGRMNVSIFFKIMFLAFLEPVMDQNMYFTGMKYTTATFATAMSNMLPSITFLMAWIFRVEKVNIKRIHSQGKILGIIVTVGGAMIMTLLQGPKIGLPWTKQNSRQHQSANTVTPQNRLKGSLMITAAGFCWASFAILQAVTLKSYPAEVSLTALICLMGSVQGTVLTLSVERGKTSIWSILQWDSKLFAALYSGIVCSGVGYYLSGKVMKERGPVFVTAFKPLGTVIVAILGSFILAEQMDLGRAKPYVAVICLQICYAGLAILAKSALSQGMNHYTFAVYRNAIAAIVLAPFAMVVEREDRPRLSSSIFIKILLLGLLEPVIDQNLYYIGMKYTTASFSAAMSNVLPAMTFLMAWICRLEKVNIRELHSQGKIVGTLVTVGGAMIMTLIKGPTIELPWTKGTSMHDESTSSTNPHNIKGSLMIAAGCLCFASFYILQAFTLQSYPAELSLAALICMTGSIQGTILTLLVERSNTSIWSLHMDARLLAAVYGGVLCSGLGYYVTGVILKERGPVFVTSFNPLSMVIVAILGSFILGEQINLGRVLGAIVIAAGLYLVIWGKSNDRRSSSRTGSDQIAPLDQQMTEMNEG